MPGCLFFLCHSHRNGNAGFQQVLERLESDPVCQRLSLKSFLILPFQRITRLKLLLQNILKRTRPGSEEEVQATQAYDALEKVKVPTLSAALPLSN